MAEDYGDWEDWLLCLCLAIWLLTGVLVHRVAERIRRLFAPLSLLRKVFGVLFLIAIPYMVSVGFGEQATSPMNPQAPILWLTAAAVNAIVFFWTCEELITTSPPLRNLFLVIVGVLVVLALHHHVNWAMAAAEDVARANEIKEAHDCINDVLTRRLYFALMHPQPKPPEEKQTPPPPVATPSRPSFPFVVPGVWFVNGAWDFIVNHRGPAVSSNVEIVLVDDVKQKQVVAGKTSLTTADINSYQLILRYQEIDPKGHGSMFATQFQWRPADPDHERYAIEINWRDGSVHEDLQIERVDGNWLEAMQIKDRETQKVLIDCKDKGFPFGPSAPKPCFPEMVQPAD